MPFDASSAVTVKLKAVPAVSVVGLVTEKCVTTAFVVEPPPHPPRINNPPNTMKSTKEFFTLPSHSGYKANQMGVFWQGGKLSLAFGSSLKTVPSIVPLRVNEEPSCSNRIYSCVTAIRLQMRHDPMDVVLDGEFRQLQACCYLFVRHPFGHQCHQLTLPARQIIRRTAELLHFFRVQKKKLVRDIFE